MLASSLLIGLLGMLLPSLTLGKPMRRAMQPSVGFTLVGPASPDTVLSLRISLVQNNYTGLIDALYDVSTPFSANYGAYLSKEQVGAYMAPAAESTSAVNTWLSENGLQARNISGAGDWLSVQIPVSTANDLLDANFSTVRRLAYSIPLDFADHIDLIHPTVSFPNAYGHVPALQTSFSSTPVENADTGPCNISLVTPTCLQWLYGIPATPATSHGNGLIVSGLVEDWPQEADLKAFLTEYRPDMDPATAWTLVSLDNGTDPQEAEDAGMKANLDVQYTMGIATDVPVTFITAGNDDNPTSDKFAEVILDTATYILGLPSPPQVITTSYGDDEDNVSEKLSNKLCSALAALGARGISVIWISGDGGVSGLHWPEETCTTFIPTFPSGCPYLTSVGGTYLIPEQAVNFSSGGFSNYFARPAYQDAAYLDYLGDTNAGLFNSTGRAYPDVAAYASHFAYINAGEETPGSGTSAAAPLFASVISLLNDELLAAGRSPLGFLNPWLYSTGISALNDITVGNNYACSDFTTGFNASAGWDPVTGLGTPNYPKLKAALGL
ncbi:family S53 protease [Rhodofomes roseus]|uniref:tripeptidyl-peptidase II n=1 Tax=Rhodofomes roseus TaxID=34475 RepID=A0ABQ8KMA3_9APHY|nr:family S53 protease [Rhodofomes roseus]KAH9839200.1 family S53 protease [Rhodofomes roseus]